ncbi:zinc ribbon domain-containing protein [bacterium]|nr:zinc ribbon domain-containing protein [bacterium]
MRLKKTRRNGVASTVPAYLLTGLGIFRCGYCGRSVKSNANRAKAAITVKKLYVYYKCNAWTKGECRARAHIQARVDAAVLGDIVKRVQAWDVVMAGYKRLENNSQRKREIDRLREQLKKAESKRDNLVRAIAGGVLELAEAREQMQGARRIIAKLEMAIDEKVADTGGTLARNVVSALRDGIVGLPDWNQADQRQVVVLLLEKIEVFDWGLALAYRFPVKRTGGRHVKLSFTQKKA